MGFPPHGFLYSNGVYTTIDNPALALTEVNAINNLGEIAGNPFIGTPNPEVTTAVRDHNLTTITGTAEGNSQVSIFEGTSFLGRVTAGSDGTWSLQSKLGNGIQSFTETSTDSVGNSASSTGVALYASSAHQHLQGGAGNDVLIGNNQATLTGAAGSDNFVFNPHFGKNTVTDFNVNQDVITFDHTLFANATPEQVLSQTFDTPAGAVIEVDRANTVTLTGVQVAELQNHLSDFHFI
jgi:hypothetical protein